MRLPTPLEWALGALAVVCLLVAAWTFDPFGRRKHAEAVAHAAVQQSAVDTVTAKAVDHYTEHVTVIHEKAARDVEKIRSAPTAGDALDPGFRDALCAAGLCDGPASADDHRSK